MIKILVVEDEKPISDLIDLNLTGSGYTCECVYDGITAADKIESNKYDLILLDIMLPGADGYELIRYIEPTNTPVIFITAKGTVQDRVRGLRAGADDYLVKPFEIVELLARVESVLRRYNKTEDIIRIGEVEINTRSRVVKKGEKPVELTMKEYDLLLLLVKNANIALFRETIYERVWGSDYLGDSRTVDIHIQRLRKKLGWSKRITSVYKVGYRLEVSN